jgi:hydrogenase maturation protein HypF
MNTLQGARIHITGVVQGVGFRPFVYGLARRLALTGRVRNTSAGVDIEVDGAPEALKTFIESLRTEAPPLARIDSLNWEDRAPDGFAAFEIAASEPIPGAFQPISPDVGLCPDCLRELFDPRDRRYRYPFINCTHCGPRFTILKDIPYDRPNTTMAPFAMCPACAAEYADPLDRRFHAQPVACPECGPHVWMEIGGLGNSPILQSLISNLQSPIEQARHLLRRGAIVAVKGLGGFHLACDATNPAAVSELRRRKLRVDKPFALMMPDMAAIEAECLVSGAERALLESRERPIVVLRRRSTSCIAAEAAPGQDTLGVMLPYTPLHYLLLERAPDFPHALVMTSGNVSEEPIATDNDEARERLAPLADAFLMHNRAIRTRCDDSVVRIPQSPTTNFRPPISDLRPPASNLQPSIFLRRSRGYAPSPVQLPFDSPPLLAAGAELKNTFCLARDRYAFLSHHIGDMENYETLCSFEDGVAHFEQLFRVRPELIACDLHPNYLAARYALDRAEREELPAIGVQHHHAHIAACLADNGLSGERPVIGVAFDGTGYGDDGAIWGGEFLIADYANYTRAFHLAYVPLPGGDAAAREPWRIALAWLDRAGVDGADDLPPVQHAVSNSQSSISNLGAVRAQLRTGLNSPPTSSLGRLFDAVSALAGVRQKVNYEAQAAIELEALADPHDGGVYPFDIREAVLDPAPLIRAVVADVRRGLPAGRIAARFHNGLALAVYRVCNLLRERYALSEVALSGGVWQNVTLLARTVTLLQKGDFTVYLHRNVPANDGGLALGQAAVAVHRMKR